MNQILSSLLTLLVTYGYPIVAGVILLSGFGFPLPASTIILAAGSFTVDGTLNFWVLVLVVAIFAIIGDILGYFLAHRFGEFVTRMTRHFGITAKQLRAADAFLLKWGVWCIFLSRWLITPLGFPVNLGAGFSKYPFKKFLAFATVGEFIWALLYSYIGHLFGVSWSSLVYVINGAPEVLALVVVGITTMVIAWRMWPRRKIVPEIVED